MIVRTGDVVAARPLDFYQAVGQRLACQGEPAMNATWKSSPRSSTASAKPWSV